MVKNSHFIQQCILKNSSNSVELLNKDNTEQSYQKIECVTTNMYIQADGNGENRIKRGCYYLTASINRSIALSKSLDIGIPEDLE